MYVCVSVSVCVCARDRAIERDREREKEQGCVCMEEQAHPGGFWNTPQEAALIRAQSWGAARVQGA